MTTGEVLFVGGPNAGQRGYLEIRDYMEVENLDETPVQDIPSPWTFDGKRQVWVCRYTKRCKFVDDCPMIYAPATWSNLDVLAELIKGYNP